MENASMESEETRGVPSLKEPRGRCIPLNLKRFTAAHLRQLGESLGLPVGKSGDEMRQLIEGKMSEREDPCVHVHVEEEPQLHTVLWLVDSNDPLYRPNPLIKSGVRVPVKSVCRTVTNLSWKWRVYGSRLGF